MISKIALCSNGMVIAFDETGDQATEFQGPAKEKLMKAIEASVEETQFMIGDWKNGFVETTKEALTTFANQFRKEQE